MLNVEVVRLRYLAGDLCFAACSGFTDLTNRENVMTMFGAKCENAITMFGVVFGAIVEKLWESVRESLWENGGKKCEKSPWQKMMVEKVGFCTGFAGGVEKFYQCFPLIRTSVRWGFCTFST